MTPGLLPYRRDVGTVTQTPLANHRRGGRYVQVVRFVDLWAQGDREHGLQRAEVVVLGARGGRMGVGASVTPSHGGPELLGQLERRIKPSASPPARVPALGWRTIELQAIATEQLELRIFGPNGGAQGAVVLDDLGRRALRQYVAAALEPERIGAAA